MRLFTYFTIEQFECTLRPARPPSHPTHVVICFVCCAGHPAQPFLVRKAAAYVTRILRIFGMSTAAPDQLGFGGDAGASAPDADGAAKYLDAFALFRDTVRSMAKGNKSSGEILAACDR